MRAAPRGLRPGTCPTARGNGAAPNRAVSQGAGLADGEASDDMPLRTVRAVHRPRAQASATSRPELALASRRAGVAGIHVKPGFTSSPRSPKRPRPHSERTHAALSQTCLRRPCKVVPRPNLRKGARAPSHANSAPRGACHRGPGLPPQPQRPSRQQQFFAWTTRCSRAPRRARRPGRTNSS